ncbi:MAG: S1 RNA-binding domain-containing protein, partial [Acidobacteriota bacterium]
MSSQENHANSGEVVTSIEAQSGAAAPERREPAEPVDVASQAQPEVETNQEPVADSKPESAPLPVEEPGTGTPEIAEPEAEAGTEAEAATSAEAAAPEVDSSTTEAIPEVDETEAANGTEGEAQASAETAAPEATSSTAEAAPEVAEPEAATSTEAGAQMSAERAAPEVISSTTEAAPEVAETEAAPSPEPAKVAEAPTHQAEESEDETLDPSEVQRLMESMEAGPSLAVGEVVQGQVLKVTEEEVFVDLGLKCEAVIPRSEFVSEDGQLTVQTGETIDVLVEKFDELTGTAVISRRKAVNEKLWEEVERAFYEEIPVKGQVVARVKGGVEVNVGVRAFMPGSQADLKPHPNLDELIGQEIICKVIKLNRKRDNVVVSRRKALEEGNQQKK